MMADAPPGSTAQQQDQQQQPDLGNAVRASPAQAPSQQPSATTINYNFQPVSVNGNVFHNYSPSLPTAAYPQHAHQPAGLTSAQHPASPPTYQQP